MKTKLIIFPATLIIALLFFFYIIKPNWDSYSANKTELTEKEQEIDKLRENKYKFDEILKNYKEIDFEEKKIIKNAFPVGFSQENFLYDLNSIVLATGVKLKNTSFLEVVSRSKEEKTLPTIKASLELTGNYFQIRKALYSIENMNRLTRIESLGMTTEKMDGANSLDAKIELLVFHKENLRSLIPSSNDKYFASLLTTGLNSDLLNNYKNYRENATSFDFNWDGEIGKDDLFETSGVSVSKEEVLFETTAEEIELEEALVETIAEEIE
jgi:Tfp pilus assembly protein PilO